MRNFIIAYPEIDVTVDVRDEEIEDHRRSAIAVVLKSGSNIEDAVFSAGESVCNPKDNFQKITGRKIAINRAKHGHNDGALEFTYNEAITMVVHESRRVGHVEGEEPIGRSIICSAITHTPLPFGLINRLKMLLPDKAMSNS